MPAMPTMTINNMTGIFMYIDALSSGWFGILLPISLFVILILSFITISKFEDSLLTASFITALASMFLFVAGILTNQGIVYAFAILTGVAVIIKVSS